MRAVLNDKALYLIFPTDSTHIDASISDLNIMLKDMVKNGAIMSDVWNPVFNGFIELSKKRNLQSTAIKGGKIND